MCGWSRSLGALQQELNDIRRLEQCHAALIRELGDQLLEAASLQGELAKASTALRGAELHVFHRAESVVGGDFLDVVRLDERRVAITVADVCGHGLAAGLFAAYLQRGLREAIRSPTTRSAPTPDGVLRRLNADVLSVDLSDCRFATVVHAIFDEQQRRLRWARAGAPEPLLVRQGTPPCPLPSRGPLLGVCVEPDFEVQETVLDPGDTVLFYTDGLYTILEGSAGRPAPLVGEIPWCRSLPTMPIEEAFDQLDALFLRPGDPASPAHTDRRSVADQLGPTSPHRDDVTAAALHIPVLHRP
jgi:serine phosphatase RsbU (regulator of sigma subunit)